MATSSIKAYINGAPVALPTAEQCFRHHHEGATDPAEVTTMWASCLENEEARDNYLPSELELVVVL